MEGPNVVKMTEVIKKFRRAEDRRNFCRENGLYFPDMVGFDYTFFISVLKETKKLLPLGVWEGFDFKYFLKDKAFTKVDLWKYFEADPALKAYIPDNTNYIRLNRKFMFALLAHLKRDVYLKLYYQYKERISSNNTSKWDNYTLTMNSEMKKKFDKYYHSDVHTREKRFRMNTRLEQGDELNHIELEGQEMEDED